jgi:dTDP-4-dehydrorhamnose 3,5-epimerase
VKIQQAPLAGLLVIEPHRFADDRGFFLESFNEKRFAAHGLPAHFRQDNHSRSIRDVLRGLHYQRRQPQGKLVTVIHGEVFDVAVDIRPDSPTFGHWHSVVLSGDEPKYVWLPPGFAHGFCVLSDVADVVYKCTELYDADDEAGVIWNDPALRIAWPIKNPVLSAKDRRYQPLSRNRTDLPHSVMRL